MTESQKRVGPYDIVRPLGRGGMGAVFLATHRELKRQVALKILTMDTSEDPTVLERFKREAQVAMDLSHPSLVKVYDYGEHGGRPYLAMEYVPGEDLADVLANGPMSCQDALRAITEVLEGLAACHAARVLHRDLKPANLLRDASGRTRILDMGLTKMLDRQTLTATGVVVGSPRYVAPETLLGEGTDARSDIYQAGVILFELIAGRPYIGRDTVKTAFHAIIMGETPEWPELPGAEGGLVRRFVERAARREPIERFQTCEEALQFLEWGRTKAATATPARPSRKVPVPPPVARPSRPPRTALAIAACGLVALAAAGAWVATRGAPAAVASREAPSPSAPAGAPTVTPAVTSPPAPPASADEVRAIAARTADALAFSSRMLAEATNDYAKQAKGQWLVRVRTAMRDAGPALEAYRRVRGRVAETAAVEPALRGKLLRAIDDLIDLDRYLDVALGVKAETNAAELAFVHASAASPAGLRHVQKLAVQELLQSDRPDFLGDGGVRDLTVLLSEGPLARAHVYFKVSGGSATEKLVVRIGGIDAAFLRAPGEGWLPVDGRLATMGAVLTVQHETRSTGVYGRGITVERLALHSK